MAIYLLFPFLLIFSLHMQRLQGMLYPIRFTVSVLMGAVAAVCILAGAWLTGHNLDLSFVSDHRFYINIASLIGLILVQMECRKEFRDNLPLLNFSGFLSLSFLPVLSVAVTMSLGFTATIEVSYSNPYDSFLVCALTLLLTCLYYGGKLRTERLSAKKLILLGSHTFMASLSVIMGVKMMQQYDAISFLLASNLFTCSTFFILSRLRAEPLATLKALHVKPMAVLVACYLLTQFVGMQIMTRIAVEEFNLVRCIGMVVVGYVYFYLLDRKVLWTNRDLFILGLMVALQLAFMR